MTKATETTDGMLAAGPELVLDVDGVVLDWLSGFGVWCETRGHVLGCLPSASDDWEMSRFLPHLDGEERAALQREFAEHQDFGRIPFFAGAAEAIAAFRKEFPEVRVSALTSAGIGDITLGLRLGNLETLRLDDLTLLPIDGCKRSALAALPAGSLFVDDRPLNVEVASSVGVSAVLFRRPYNRSHTHDLVVEDWPDLARVLSSHFRPAERSNAS